MILQGLSVLQAQHDGELPRFWRSPVGIPNLSADCSGRKRTVAEKWGRVICFMKQTNKCPKCGSTEILADAKAIDRGHSDLQREFSVATFGKPDALIFKEQHKSTISAWVCGQCGYLELYADSPSSLKLAKA